MEFFGLYTVTGGLYIHCGLYSKTILQWRYCSYDCVKGSSPASVISAISRNYIQEERGKKNMTLATCGVERSQNKKKP